MSPDTPCPKCASENFIFGLSSFFLCYARRKEETFVARLYHESDRATAWKSVRVFNCALVFPRLSEQLLVRSIHLVDVDLLNLVVEGF